MKSSAPWSVKGIERDARETAKEAARREGMTVGEWLCQVIYAASDPQSSNGEIEGIKTSDIVTAIEHLNKRVIAAEAKGSEAIEELARNLSGALERVQRLERARPAPDAPSVEERLRRLEARLGDRQRIEALKALEKAVGQVAIQYDAAQKTTLARLDSTERQLQELASRLEAPAGGAGEKAAASHLKLTIDNLTERLERAERIAAEAARMKEEASESVDADFVERTGARLRVLGDEIKRSGDQIRSLEGLIKKLSDQIDAAERRSSEGVQKVSETISELKSQFGQSEAQETSEARQEIEAAMAEVTKRTEARIAELQRSFEAMLARIEQEPAPAIAGPEAAEGEKSAPAAGVDDALTAFEAENEDVESIFDDALESDLDPAQAEEIEDEDGFSFRRPEEEAEDPLALLNDRDGEEKPAIEATADKDPLGVDSLLAELDALSTDSPAAREPVAKEDEGADDASPDWLRAHGAGEPETPLTGDQTPTRRKLTPRQRAILAAKIRRKRLAERGLQMTDAAPAPSASAPSPDMSAAEETVREKASPSLLSKATGALGRIAGPSERKDEEIAPFAGDARAALARIGGVKPVTLALGAAVLLASTALVFVVKDFVSGDMAGSAGTSEEAAPQAASPETVAETETTQAAPAPETSAASVPAAPQTPLTQPRALYLDAIARLGAARNDSETRAALQILQQAAALGHPPAQLQLGELYKLGQGVAQDPVQARTWYQRAAEGGNVLAMHRAGMMAAQGQGGPADQTAAIAWFEKAANLGLVDSQYNLGTIYHPAGGGGGAASIQDPAKAYYWYSLAARNGDDQARILADGLASSLAPSERRTIDERTAAWTAQTPDPEANEVAPASE